MFYEDDNEIDMPKRCMECGKIFDLLDGTSFKNYIYCYKCGTKLNEIESLNCQIEALKQSLADEKKTVCDSLANIEDYKTEIKKLKAEKQLLE